MNRLIALILASLATCAFSDESEQTWDRNQKIVYMGNVFSTRDRLHKIYLGRADLAVKSMLEELGRDVRYLYNIYNDKDNDETIRGYASTVLVDLAVFIEVFEIAELSNDEEISEILDKMKEDHPESYKRSLCEDWSSPTGIGEQLC